MNSTTFVFMLVMIWLTLLTISFIWCLKFRQEEIAKDYISIEWLLDNKDKGIEKAIKEWDRIHK